mmetsp:Transcript_37890/g.77772  ORF Transcript_37890/g.77772 Transcript_37890/m.77772 type:complete len:359 (+) Transcript_37890:40-1116(+)|eukprot:CAMPEP_0181346368 /NCGR_PEP_ID=MMETSP1101-20121128/33290_1 /TAXON_ID=46948 /ORGANISM="Rhodomonas abbreviata, Strain Caron Lab Isolate" /LENGTH=358 /DNA_ID=CAMNT_0023458475 /DNA_START=31 /DNA_END=1107 /DNA_ORIENTATION=+
MAEHKRVDKENTKDEKVSTRSCGVCGDRLELDHAGIRCKNAHHLCPECSENYKNGVMNEASMDMFPPKCSFCACEVDLPSFERQLTDAQRDTFLSIMMMKELEPGEIVQSCPFCPFFCTRFVGTGGSSAQALFIHCLRSDCSKVSCSICLKECKDGEHDSDEDDEAVQLGMIGHFECARREQEWGMWRREFEEAIESGIKFPCPKCNQAGMKDDACTHMTCESCQTVWCYICGLDTKLDECSKAVAGGGHSNMAAEYRHNVNWHAIEGRCPMDLSEIHQVDASWPEDGEEAKEKLHWLRCVRNLKRLYDKMGQQKYRQLVEAFPQLGAASGFDEATIQATDVAKPLFCRSFDFEEEEE